MNTQNENKIIKILYHMDYFSDKENFIDIYRFEDKYREFIGLCIKEHYSKDTILSDRLFEEPLVLDVVNFKNHPDKIGKLALLFRLIMTIFEAVEGININSIIRENNLYDVIGNAKTESDYLDIYRMITDKK
ncbi:MAG: hypothetical protein KatS3mg002_1079 [Candidatus Woesearchaeota archaeon]|nr:MAG: hypothetical protein KatS3mg002_1079 [Candidatus Woesearchaeota archaeon]